MKRLDNEKMRLIDGHAHLEEIENLEGVIARAEAAGVFAVIAVGSDYDSLEAVARIKGVSEKEVAEITTNNALKLFQLDSIQRSMR